MVKFIAKVVFYVLTLPIFILILPFVDMYNVRTWKYKHFLGFELNVWWHNFTERRDEYPFRFLM